ncbi:glycerate kinase [compost metagenome]
MRPKLRTRSPWDCGRHSPDGGEGTTDATLATTPGERRSARVTGPLGQLVNAQWGWLPDSRTAIIEMAEASGLQLVPVEQRDAYAGSTQGTGRQESVWSCNLTQFACCFRRRQRPDNQQAAKHKLAQLKRI